MAGGIIIISGKLTDRAIKSFVSKAERAKKLPDGGGLHVFISPAGGIIWRIKYRIDGKEKIYSIGPYPLISLSAARAELSEVKSLLLENKDPVSQRRINRAESNAAGENTFEAVAGECLAMKQKEWSAGHFLKSSRALERDIYPTLGKLPIASISPAIVAKAVEDINKRDVLETATRILQHLNGVFRYAQAKGLCRDNPALAAREILPQKKDSGRMPALLDYVSLRNRTRKLSPGSIASYISKYISKSISDVATNRKSYWISHNIAAPIRTVKLFRTLGEALSWLMLFMTQRGFRGALISGDAGKIQPSEFSGFLPDNLKTLTGFLCALFQRSAAVSRRP